MNFKLHTQLKPADNQSRAIAQLASGVKNGEKHQVLHGVTGSGKTFTIANVIEQINRPTLVISHNKTLAWQLYQEFKEFFPQNAVHYFVSYYDYYQPEAYIPTTDTYISKDASVNKKIDAMRHGAVQSLLTRQDTIIVASVSCIYNLGSPETYQKVTWEIEEGQKITRKEFLRSLVRLGYERNDFDPFAGRFCARASLIEIHPPTGEEKIIVELEKNQIKKIHTPTPPTKTIGLPGNPIVGVKIYPANFWVTPEDKLHIALNNINTELQGRIKELKSQGKEIEAYRIEQKTNYDLEMMKQMGYTSGIENYSSHLEFRESGTPPFTLLNYFSKNFLTIIDESHMTIPQITGMYAGDRSRKKTLIEHGFRLPSALDNRPLTFKEFGGLTSQIIYMSATPREYETQLAQRRNIAEQIVRPTGLLDPMVEVRNTKNQMQNATEEIKNNVKNGQRTLVVTITKRLAEEVAEYLKEKNISVNYIHSEIDTLTRPVIMNKLREGEYDVLVGVNLLREGLDLPEVSLVIIFDADKEGFLRNETTLLQTMGRAARHVEGRVILYADKITRSMRLAINETKHRREIQKKFNEKNNITPRSIEKKIHELPEEMLEKEKIQKNLAPYQNMAIGELEREMKRAAKNLDFELAATLRNEIKKLSNK